MGRKSKHSDLGRALANRKQREKQASKTSINTAAAQRAAAMGRHSLTYDERGKLQSVLDATDLEELMLNATMANKDFASERYPGPLAPQTVVVTPLNRDGGFTGVEKEKRRALDRTVLRIPRRPAWDVNTTAGELLARETEDFLNWRRKIAGTEEEHEMDATIGGPMMTPFEKNLEVWRQLWRVVERSDVVVQIVDARDPLLYYCEDLYRYVTDEMGRAHLLLLNKADLLSEKMISKWQGYFEKQGLDVLFFSAFKASVNERVDDSRVVGVEMLIEFLHGYERKAPQTQENQRLVIGMCGYPNVGKSSTINVLLESVARAQEEAETIANASSSIKPEQSPSEAESSIGNNTASSLDPSTWDSPAKPAPLKHIKRVAVSSTPGKTKHFQTLVLTPSVLLCDCPGLVFPNFSSSKSELIIAGILSIDQMRGDHLKPVSLIASRIPSSLFSVVYGIRFPTFSQGVTTDTDASLLAKPGYVSATVLLDTHARARGFMTDHGQADTSRSARALLKDYVSGRIIFAHGPPPDEVGGGESGLGPGVHAKKGALMHKRIDEEKMGVANVKSEVGASGGGGGVEEEVVDVRARVSGSKKHRHKVFTRVERSYYPSVD